MDILEVAVILAALVAVYGVTRNLRGARRNKAQDSFSNAYEGALSVKDETIKELRSQLKSWQGKASMAAAPPYGATDIGDIVSKLPSWAKPFIKPLTEYAASAEGQDMIQKLIAKYAKAPEQGTVTDGEAV